MNTGHEGSLGTAHANSCRDMLARLEIMTLIRWLLKIPMMLGNILLYFLSIIFILTGVLSYGFALESARECGRMIIIGMAFGAIPDFVPFLGKSLETLVAKLLSMTNE